MRLRQDDLRFDLPALQRAIGPRTRAVVFSQPGNPGGVTHRQQDLEALAEILEQANAARDQPLMLISDECHRDFANPAGPMPAAIYPHTCTVYSFGKRLFIQGQRIGYAAVSPNLAGREPYRRLLVQLCRVMGFCTPTALMQQALGRLLVCPVDVSPILARRDRMAAALAGMGYEFVPPDATFFIYLRTPPGWTDDAFVTALAERGVLVLPASLFHDTGHVRLSITDTEQAVDAALPVFEQLVGQSGRP